MKLSTTQILYNPEDRQVTLLPNVAGDWRIASMSSLSSNVNRFVDVQLISLEGQAAWLFRLAVHLIVRDGLDPQLVHNTLCEIREYRDGLAPDMPVPEYLQEKFNAERKGETFNAQLGGDGDDRPF